MKTFVVSVRRVDLAVLRALPGFVLALATVFFVAGVGKYYAEAPYMLWPLVIPFSGWALSMVHPQLVLTARPPDERVRALLYCNVLMLVWGSGPLLYGLLCAAGTGQTVADGVAWLLMCAVGVGGNYFAKKALVRHVAGLRLVEWRQRMPWPFAR